MKTKNSTKFMFALAGSLLAIGSIQAQETKHDRDSLLGLQRNAISLIDPGMGKAAGASGFWGYAFGDYAYMGHGDSAGRGTKQQYKGLGAAGNQQTSNPNAFEVRRAYLGYDYTINSKFSAYALLAYEGDQDVSDNRTVYLKYIYFKWKNIFKGSDLKIGQQATNSFANAYNTEPLMGYRSVEKTIMDMHGIDGSSDMGVTLEGRVWTHHGGDTTKVPTFIGYSAMIGDNSGNNPVPAFTGTATSLTGAVTSTPVDALNATTDKNKKFRGNLYVNALNSHLTVGAYMDYINYGDALYYLYKKDLKGLVDSVTGGSNKHGEAVTTMKLYAAYNAKWFGIGFEWFTQSMSNGETETWSSKATGETNDTVNAVQTGYSIFAHGTIIPGTLNIFARYDMYTPDNTYSYNTENVTTTVAGKQVTTLYTETFTNHLSNISSISNTYNGITSSVAGNTYKESFFNAGLDWTPTKDKKIHLMPNIWYYAIKNGFGSGALASDNYMLYRVTFLFAFN